MELEIQQIDLRYRELRIISPHRLHRLMADLDEVGQQIPVVVISATTPQRYVLIDGYGRCLALRRLGRDTIEAVCLELSEDDALLWRHQRQGGTPTALEEGWFLRELRDVHGFPASKLAQRLSRSQSWVSRRLALVDALPRSVQQLVRDGKLCPYAASKYLVPLARAKTSDCETLAKNIASQKLSARQICTLYVGWRQGDDQAQKRLVEAPMLYLSARAEVDPDGHDAHPDGAILGDLDSVDAILRRLERRLRRRHEDMPLSPALGVKWTAVQRAFDAIFSYLGAEQR